MVALFRMFFIFFFELLFYLFVMIRLPLVGFFIWFVLFVSQGFFIVCILAMVYLSCVDRFISIRNKMLGKCDNVRVNIAEIGIIFNDPDGIGAGACHKAGP